MNNEPNNDNVDSAKPDNNTEVKTCEERKKNSCVCPNKSNNSSEEVTDEKNTSKSKPYRISWI